MPNDFNTILATIKKNLHRVNTTADLAVLLNTSEEALKKYFARTSQNNVGETIDHFKIEKMKFLLLTTEMKCLSICLQVGLQEDSGAHFFRRHTGMTMKEYRMKHRADAGGGGSML